MPHSDPFASSPSALGLTLGPEDTHSRLEVKTADELVALILPKEAAYPHARMYLASLEPGVLAKLFSSLHPYNLKQHAETLEFLLGESEAAKSPSLAEELRLCAPTKTLYWLEYHYLSPAKAEAAWRRYRHTAGQRAARRRRIKTDTAKAPRDAGVESADWVCSYQLFD